MFSKLRIMLSHVTPYVESRDVLCWDTWYHMLLWNVSFCTRSITRGRRDVVGCTSDS